MLKRIALCLLLTFAASFPVIAQVLEKVEGTVSDLRINAVSMALSPTEKMGLVVSLAGQSRQWTLYGDQAMFQTTYLTLLKAYEDKWPVEITFLPDAPADDIRAVRLLPSSKE